MTSQPKKKALVISVSKYNDQELDQLSYVENDGKEMYSVLKELDFDIPSERMIVGEVDYNTMRLSINNFFRDRELNPEDMLLLYYSGHGDTDGFKDRFFCTTEYDRNNPDSFGIPFHLITNQISKSNAKKIIVILDCCFSGGLNLGPGKSSDSKGEDDAEKQGNEAINEEFANSQGLCVLASSLSNRKSFKHPDKDISAFTNFLIEGLRENKESVDSEGYVTPESLDIFIFKKLKSLIGSNIQRPQRTSQITGKLILAEYPKFRTKQSSEKDLDKIINKINFQRKPGTHIELKPSNEEIKMLDELYGNRINLPNSELIKVALSFSRLGDYARANSVLEQVLKKDPSNYVALADMGSNLLELGNLTEAIKYIDESLEHQPKHFASLYNKGNILIRNGDLKNAKIWMDKALEVEPHNEVALNNMGILFARMGEFRESITYYDRALEIDPKYILPLNNKGIAYGNLGNHKEALACFEKTLEIDPKNIEALINMGFSLINLERSNDALGPLNQALSLAPDDYNVLNMKALACLYTDPSESISCLEKSSKIKPNQYEVFHNMGMAWNNIGLAENNQDNLRKAIYYFDKALEISPHHFRTLNSKGMAYGNLGDFKEALHWFEEAIKANPNYFTAINNRDLALKVLSQKK